MRIRTKFSYELGSYITRNIVRTNVVKLSKVAVYVLIFTRLKKKLVLVDTQTKIVTGYLYNLIPFNGILEPGFIFMHKAENYL